MKSGSYDSLTLGRQKVTFQSQSEVLMGLCLKHIFLKIKIWNQKVTPMYGAFCDIVQCWLELSKSMSNFIFVFIFSSFILFLWVLGLHVVHVNHDCVWCLWSSEGASFSQILCNWNYRHYLIPMWVLRTEPRSSVKATSTFSEEPSLHF